MANEFDDLLSAKPIAPAASGNEFDDLLAAKPVDQQPAQAPLWKRALGSVARGLDYVGHLGQDKEAKAQVQAILNSKTYAPETVQQLGREPGFMEPVGGQAMTGPSVPPWVDARPAAAGMLDMATSPMSYLGVVGKPLGMGLKALGVGAKIPVQLAAAGIDAARGGTEAADVIQGTKQGLQAYGARQVAKAGEVLNPQLAPDVSKYQEIGKSVGLTPQELQHPAIEYGELSTQARRNKVLAQGEGGGPVLAQHNAITQKIQNGFDGAIQKIGGAPLEPVDAGDLIRQGVKDGAKRIADGVSASHNDIIDQFPGLAVNGDQMASVESKLNGIEKFAKGRVERGIDPAQRGAAQTLLNAVDAARKTNGSYKQLNEAREMAGEVAFGDVGAIGKVPAYQQKLRDLYFTLDDALVGTVGKLDKVRAGQFRPVGQTFEPLKEQLIQSNKTLHEMFQDEGSVGRALGNDQKAPEQIFNQAVLYGDTRKVQALKNLLTPEQFQQVKGSYVNALVKRGKDTFSYKSAKNAMANNRSVLGEMFSDAPDEINRVKDIVDLGDRVGTPILPGSAGQLDFGGANSLGRLLHKATEPIGDITAEIGKVRSKSAPRVPRDLSMLKQIPPSLVVAGDNQDWQKNLPPYLRNR